MDMLESDRNMLLRMTEQSDPEAFSEIMRQYAHVVYGASHRVLGNDAQAADVVQETFLHFLKHADRVTESLGCWLHRVATRRAIDLVRQDVSRRRREEAYAASHLCETDDWHEIEPLVDEALDEVPDELREILIWHYLEGKSMTQIAVAKGMSQPTISRRMATALEQMRYNLRNKGVVTGLTLLASLLASSTQAAPAAILQSLGKMALAQAAATSPILPAVASASLVTAAGSKAGLAVAALVVLSTLTWFIAPQIATSTAPSAPGKPTTTPLTSLTSSAQDTSAAADEPGITSADPETAITILEPGTRTPGTGLPVTSAPASFAGAIPADMGSGGFQGQKAVSVQTGAGGSAAVGAFPFGHGSGITASNSPGWFPPQMAGRRYAPFGPGYRGPVSAGQGVGTRVGNVMTGSRQRMGFSPGSGVVAAGGSISAGGGGVIGMRGGAGDTQIVATNYSLHWTATNINGVTRETQSVYSSGLQMRIPSVPR
jgi:RNA polymerase sigma-70 factor (ECF subfamily)